MKYNKVVNDYQKAIFHLVEAKKIVEQIEEYLAFKVVNSLTPYREQEIHIERKRMLKNTQKVIDAFQILADSLLDAVFLKKTIYNPKEDTYEKIEELFFEREENNEENKKT